MEFNAIARDRVAFQQPVTQTNLQALACRAFGAGTEVQSATELSGGHYNTTFDVRIRGHAPLILRVAPEPARQSRLEYALMRNEYASLPYFASLRDMFPQIMFADWTHDLIDRDYLWQTRLNGVPGLIGIKAYPRTHWLPLYQQLGSLTRQVHQVRGTRFGSVAGPYFDIWSEFVLATLDASIGDLADAGLDTSDVTNVIKAVERQPELLDEIKESRLLHGDLWTGNLLLADGAVEPTVVGVVDNDRASWGDPAADWGCTVILSKSTEAQAAFAEAYGAVADTPAARWRALVYRAMHLIAGRLERHRLGNSNEVTASYDELRSVLQQL